MPYNTDVFYYLGGCCMLSRVSSCFDEKSTPLSPTAVPPEQFEVVLLGEKLYQLSFVFFCLIRTCDDLYRYGVTGDLGELRYNR